MHRITLKREASLAAVFCGMLILFSIHIQSTYAEFEECIGKIYGTPGCPEKEDIEEEEIIPQNCGDGYLDVEDEECDLGRFNGLTNCTEDCKLLFCGDTTVSAYLGEECEPETEEYYALDTETDTLTIEIRFIEPSCGTGCEPPVCGSDGTCTGGCRLMFLPECSGDEQPEIVEAKESPDSEGIPEEQHAAAPEDPAAEVQDETEVSEPDTQQESETTEESLGVPEISLPATVPTQQVSTQQVSTQQTTFPQRCGNGIIESGEECDDGNAINSDNCPNNCILPECGNGIREGKEECDDGNSNTFDACPTDCKKAVCGDGIREGSEQCDDGNGIDTDDCPNNCRAAYCGNGIREGKEECDDGNKNNFDDCPSDCIKAVCGDSIREGEEECDDGNKNARDKCDNQCIRNFCGDGKHMETEECDDGNDDNTDMCTTKCRFPVCGDGFVQEGEDCDDKNKNDYDSCSNECTRTQCGDGVEQKGEECDDGNDSNYDECTVDCKLPFCGDEFKQLDEECDYGIRNSDTAPDTCRSDCRLPFCGDGIVDTGSGEQCDGGEDCTDTCMNTTPLTILSMGNIIGGLILLVGSLTFILLIIRHPKAKLDTLNDNVLSTPVQGEKTVKKPREKIHHSGNVPLSDLELPWHTWNE